MYIIIQIVRQAKILIHVTIEDLFIHESCHLMHACMLSKINSINIRLEKHLQCEQLLGLAGGTTKKRGNKKSDESITPIRYNVIHMYYVFPANPSNFYLDTIAISSWFH